MSSGKMNRALVETFVDWRILQAANAWRLEISRIGYFACRLVDLKTSPRTNIGIGMRPNSYGDHIWVALTLREPQVGIRLMQLRFGIATMTLSKMVGKLIKNGSLRLLRALPLRPPLQTFCFPQTPTTFSSKMDFQAFVLMFVKSIGSTYTSLNARMSQKRRE